MAERGSGDLQRLQRGDWDSAAGGGERVDQLALVVVELAVGGFQNRDFHGARGVAGGGNIFALQPFLADHSGEYGFGDAGGGAEGFFADEVKPSGAKALLLSGL